MTKLVWMPRAQRNLREIKAFIARDKPKAARDFIKRLKAAVQPLKRFPRLGWIVEEFQDPDIREIAAGNYRVIYRCKEKIVQILTAFHGSKLLRPSDVERQ